MTSFKVYKTNVKVDEQQAEPAKESFVYGLIKYGTPIYKNASQTGAGATTIHTITTGNVFFLTSISLTAHSTAANDIPFYIQSTNNGALLYIRLPPGAVTDQTEEKTITFNQPVIFYQKDVISVYSGSAAGKATGIITGYEIDYSKVDKFT